MKISDNVHILEFGEPNRMVPVIVRGENGLLLVDAGLPGQFEILKEAIAAEGFCINDLKAILLTHQDLDHMGGVNEIKAAVSGLAVYAHETEAPYIDGREKPYKLRDKLASYNSLAQEAKQDVDDRVENAKKFTCTVDKTLKDGDILPEFQNIQVIHTPGHTSGHICLYLPESKALITGDGLVVSEGNLKGPMPMYTYDMTLAVKSLEKLLDYDIEVVLAYHGGVFRGDVKAALARIL